MASKDISATKGIPPPLEAFCRDKAGQRFHMVNVGAWKKALERSSFEARCGIRGLASDRQVGDMLPAAATVFNGFSRATRETA